MKKNEFKCEIIVDENNSIRIIINDKLQNKLFNRVDDAIFALDSALIRYYDLCRNKIQAEFIIKNGGTVKYFNNEEEEDEFNFELPEDIYCLECNEEKRLTYLCSYANGDEYRCENCKNEFVWEK